MYSKWELAAHKFSFILRFIILFLQILRFYPIVLFLFLSPSFVPPIVSPLSTLLLFVSCRAHTFPPSLPQAVLLLRHALFYLSPMRVIPSPLLPASNSVQISVKQQVTKYSIYQEKHKINTHPMQTQHTGSSADLPMTLTHAVQLSLVIRELKKKTTTLCFCQSHQKCFTRCTLNTVFSF